MNNFQLGITARRSQNEEPTAMLYMRVPRPGLRLPAPRRRDHARDRPPACSRTSASTSSTLSASSSQGYHMNFHMAVVRVRDLPQDPHVARYPDRDPGQACRPSCLASTARSSSTIEPKDSLKRVKVHINVRPTYVSLFFS